MKAELREQLGKAAYEATHPIKKEGNLIRHRRWDEQNEDTREDYRREAEAVAQELGGMMVAQLQYVAMALTDWPIEIHLGEKVAQWPKKES